MMNNSYKRHGILINIALNSFVKYINDNLDLPIKDFEDVYNTLSANFIKDDTHLNIIKESLKEYIRHEVFNVGADEKDIIIFYPDFEYTRFFPKKLNLQIMVDIQFNNKECYNQYKIKNPDIYHTLTDYENRFRRICN